MERNSIPYYIHQPFLSGGKSNTSELGCEKER